MIDSDREKIIFHLKEKLHRLGLKLTKQREAICEAFFAQIGHCSAEQILKDVRVLDPNVSLATVYRTLKLLQESGLAISHNFQDGQALFEPNFLDSEHHDHLICINCGYILEFVDDEIEQLQARVATLHKFTLTYHKMELYGLCPSCQAH